MRVLLTTTALVLLAYAAACSSTSRHTVEQNDAAGGAGATESGAGESGSGGNAGGGAGGASDASGGFSGSGGSGGAAGSGATGGSDATGGSGATGGFGATGGSGGSGIDCPGVAPCTRAVYRIDGGVSGITRMDPYEILGFALGPDFALSQQTATSDDVRTAGVETYLFFVISCPTVREYGLTWEGHADVASTREVLVAIADRTYTAPAEWPTQFLSEVPTDRDVKHTVRGLVPDTLGNIFVRINGFGGDQFTDWLAVGSCI